MLVEQGLPDRTVPFFVIELAQSGELYNWVAHGQKFPESFARYFFRQIITGIEYLHNSGFAHRDLKMENVLIGADRKVKIADFGLAGPIIGKDASGYLKSIKGTVKYRAPEITSASTAKYMGAMADIFSLGVILFNLVTRLPPFNKAEISDSYYRLIASNRADVFWKYCQSFNLSEELKELITSMLNPLPTLRPSIADIKSHPWYTNAEVPTD